MTDTPSGPQIPERPLRQAERYGGPASRGRVSERAGAPGRGAIAGLYLAGGAMIATTLFSGWLGAPAWAAFLLGLAVFLVLALRLRPGADKTPPRRVDVARARKDHVDIAQAEGRLAAAEARLERIETLAAGFEDRALEDRVRAMTDAARATLDALAADPGDIARAKKFLVVTLPSAEAAVEKYAALGVKDPALSDRFGALMDEVAEACRRQKESLGRDDAFALEVEMEVLADRLRAG